MQVKKVFTEKLSCLQTKAAKQEDEDAAQEEEDVQEEDEEDAEHAETATEQPKINNKPVVSPLAFPLQQTALISCTS